MNEQTLIVKSINAFVSDLTETMLLKHVTETCHLVANLGLV